MVSWQDALLAFPSYVQYPIPFLQTFKLWMLWRLAFRQMLRPRKMLTRFNVPPQVVRGVSSSPNPASISGHGHSIRECQQDRRRSVGFRLVLGTHRFCRLSCERRIVGSHGKKWTGPPRASP